MDTFTFKLQPVLDHRRRLEDQAKQEFAKAQSRELEARQVLADMEWNFGEGQSEMAEAARDDIDLAEVSACQRYLNRLRTAMLEQNDLVATLHLTSEEKRTGVVDGMKARKIVEKLKEKEYEQYMVDINRLEQKQTDELATTRHGRSKKWTGL
ncbi:MAG: flagellar export protein FliJ [Bacillota bacterium]